MGRQLEDKAKLERLQFRAEVRIYMIAQVFYQLLFLIAYYIPINCSSQKRTKLKEQLGLDDRWGVESSDSEGKIPPPYEITNIGLK